LRADTLHFPLYNDRTKLIQDQNSPNPRYRGLIHGTRSIIAEQGISGIYQGVTTVVARQGANSAVRLTVYGLMKEKVAERYKEQELKTGKVETIPWHVTFGMGELLLFIVTRVKMEAISIPFAILRLA
jgi:solute carrier family 25 citrate transporter 1